MSNVYDMGSTTVVATDHGQYSFYTPPKTSNNPFPIYILRPPITSFELPPGSSIKDAIRRYGYEQAAPQITFIVKVAQEETKKSVNAALENVVNIIDSGIYSSLNQKLLTIDPAQVTPLVTASLEKTATLETLAAKRNELANAHSIANSYFGKSPLNVNHVEVTNDLYRRSGDKYVNFANWSKSYSAAQNIRLIEAEIVYLENRLKGLDAKIAELASIQQAQEAQRAVMAEQDRKAEEQRLAEERKRSEEARRREQEEAQRIAREALIAEAQRRLEEALKRQQEVNKLLEEALKSEEAARRAEEVYARIADLDQPSQVAPTPVPTNPGSGTVPNFEPTTPTVTPPIERDTDLPVTPPIRDITIPDQQPAPSAPGISDIPSTPGVSLPVFPGFPGFNKPAVLASARAGATVTANLQTAVRLFEVYRKSPTALIGQAIAVFGLLGISALLPKLKNGELQPMFGIPVSELDPPKNIDWQALAASGGSVNLPLRLGTSKSGQYMQIGAMPTETWNSAVPVRPLTFDAATGNYQYVNTGPGGGTILISPDSAPGAGNPSSETPATPVLPLILSGGNLIPRAPMIESYPDMGERSFNDGIYVFPSETGLPPIYIVYRDRRDDPGVASGYGQPISGQWLGGNHGESGAPIPSQIADKLRGKEFKSWRDFREQFWTAVSNDPELLAQFRTQSQTRIKAGYAPWAPAHEHVGGLNKYEIHHIEYISNGGSVYDIENLRIMTPKQHKETHQQN